MDYRQAIARNPRGPNESLRGRGRSYAFDLLLVVIAIGIMYYIAPHFVQLIGFGYIIRNIAVLLPWIAVVVLVIRYLKHRYVNSRRAIIGIVTTAVLSLIWSAGLLASRELFVFKAYGQYAQRDDLVATAPESVRYTPLSNACVDMAGTINTSSEHVDCKYVAPIISRGKRFGYVAPIMPSGVLQTFQMKNPGFVRLDDSPEFGNEPMKRIQRVDAPQEIGPGMEWFDNLERVLALNDFFAWYEKPHYLALNPAQPEELTAVVSKVKYTYLWQLPYWAGVVLVHANGKLEDLDKEVALKDPRLKGQWLYPIDLDRRYVGLQNYATGWGLLSRYVRVPGKLQIEELPGDNQFPFLVQGADGNPYLVTATKGEGSAQGLFRMYFRNAYTGEATYHEFKPGAIVYGAGAALRRASNIPGYNWHRKSGDSSSGNIIAVEPVYITKPGDVVPYWKFTITNENHAGISATAVAYAAQVDDFKMFHTHVDFVNWLEGVNAQPHPQGTAATSRTRNNTAAVLKEMGALLRQMEQMLGELERQLPQQ